MVRSVKNDPRIKRVGGASDETAALVSRVQVLKVGSTGGNDKQLHEIQVDW